MRNYLKHRGIICGAECECIIYSDKITRENLVRKLKEIHPKIICGDDCSIEGNGYNEFTVEIRTPPLPIAKSLIVINRVFELIQKYGYTNDSAGFHASISPVSKHRYYSFNPFKFCIHGIWERIVKDFKRHNNEYCSVVKIPKKTAKYVDVFRRSSYFFSHHTCINLENYHIKRRKDSRIEVRGFGNSSYEKKFDKIKNYLNQIIGLYLEATENG